jgi:hypothetical protein
MAYWVKRIVLKDGEVVTEAELRDDENHFEGRAPVVGDLLEVQCRGRTFMAEVISGNWPDRVHPLDTVVPLRVVEIGLDPATPLRFPRRAPSTSRK